MSCCMYERISNDPNMLSLYLHFFSQSDSSCRRIKELVDLIFRLHFPLLVVAAYQTNPVSGVKIDWRILFHKNSNPGHRQME